jgi:hypothetical protein
MAVNDKWRVVLFSSTPSQAGLNVLHFRTVSETAPGVLQSDVATFLGSVMPTPYKPLLSSSATYRGLSVQKLIGAPLFIPAIDKTLTGVGGGAADLLPTQTCGLITWQSLIVGRANRGRSYLPFPGKTADDTDGTPTPAYLTLLGTWAALAIAPFIVPFGADTCTLQLCVVHRNGTLGPDLLQARINDKWGTQRRRGTYGRTNVVLI